MEGCPYCVDMKQMLKEENIEFVDLDIQENSEEYSMFVKIVENDYVPAFMIVDTEGSPTKFMAPDRDFEDIEDAVVKIKSNLNYL
jgi:glutaredoxin